MKKYMKPIMNGEIFTTNEYVAACWGVGCDYDRANKIIEPSLKNNPAYGHQRQYCGQIDHQHVVLGSNGKPVGIQELGSAYADVLEGTLYTDNTYTKEMSSSQIENIKIGDEIHWITVGTGWGQTSIYHHVGEVIGTTKDHPNASI